MSAAPAEEPALARQVLDLDHAASDVLLGLIAGHFATTSTLTSDRLSTYVEESMAVTK